MPVLVEDIVDRMWHRTSSRFWAPALGLLCGCLKGGYTLPETGGSSSSTTSQGPGSSSTTGSETSSPTTGVAPGSSTTDDVSASGESGTSTTGDIATLTSSSSGSTGSSSSTGATDETLGDTTMSPEPSMLGEACANDLGLFCENGGPKRLGTLLQCKSGQWAVADLDQICDLGIYCPAAELGLNDPVPVGCSGVDEIDISCVCRDTPPAPCDGSEVGCDGQAITLCVDLGDGATHLRGQCATHCEADPDGPTCQPA